MSAAVEVIDMRKNRIYHNLLDLGSCGFIEDLLSAKYSISEIDQKFSIGPKAYIEVILEEDATIEFVKDVRSYKASGKIFKMSYRVTSINLGSWFHTTVSGDLGDIKALQSAAERAGAKLVSQ